jgi:hypothetical protein
MLTAFSAAAEYPRAAYAAVGARTAEERPQAPISGDPHLCIENAAAHNVISITAHGPPFLSGSMQNVLVCWR